MTNRSLSVKPSSSFKIEFSRSMPSQWMVCMDSSSNRVDYEWKWKIEWAKTNNTKTVERQKDEKEQYKPIHDND